MADDQSQKTSTIDELVNELTKKTATPPPLPNPQVQQSRPAQPNQSQFGPSLSQPPQQNRNPFPSPRPNMPPQQSQQAKPDIFKSQPTPPPQASVPRPDFSSPKVVAPPQPMARPVVPLQAQSAPAKPTPPPMPSTKEYQSSIRTMAQDTESLKKGQKPAGLEVPRKFEPGNPSVPEIAPAPSPVLPRSPISSVELGRADKATPLRPSINVPPKKIEEPPKVKMPPAGISVPPTKRGLNPIIFVGIAIIAVLVGALYWFFVLRTTTPVVTQSPTPTPSQSQAPQVSLRDIFQGLSNQEIKLGSNADVAGFKASFKAMGASGGEFKILDAIVDEAQAPVSLSVNAVLAAFAENISQDFLNGLGQDSIALVYGQKEFFDSKGQLKASSPAPRLVMVFEVKDSLVVGQFLNQEEPNLATDLKDLFNIDPAKQASQDFLDNSYRNNSIRYKNFSFPDQAIDYALINALNNKTYLVISGSRESMFVSLDKLLGF